MNNEKNNTTNNTVDNTIQNEIINNEIQNEIINNEIQNEIYSVDFLSPYFLYSGSDQKCTIYDTKSHSISTVIEGFTESVIFCKFITDNQILTCTLDGNILMTSIDGTSTRETQVNDEISCVQLISTYIFIGTSSGIVYQIDIDDLDNQRVYMGHSNEILDIQYYNDTVYSLSENILMSHNTSSGNQKYSIHLREGTSFSMIPNTEIFCVCTNYNILVYKNTTLLNKFTIDGQAETVIYTEGYFVVGGYCDYLLLINTKANMVPYKFKLVSSGINKLISQDYTIYFSTTCGYVGVCDIRKDDSVQMYESRVETVFNMCVSGTTFYIGGLKGVDILSMEDFS